MSRIGYKLFEMNEEGKLFALFIDKNTEMPMNEWIHAECHITKSFAPRPGFHVGADLPDASWLKSYDGSDVGYYNSRWKHGKRVWCEVLYNDTINYNEYVQTLPKKCMQDKVPENGFYFFREVGKGTWIITSDIMITRILSDEERRQILLEKGYDEVSAYKKYKETFEKRIATREAKKKLA